MVSSNWVTRASKVMWRAFVSSLTVLLSEPSWCNLLSTSSALRSMWSRMFVISVLGSLWFDFIISMFMSILSCLSSEAAAALYWCRIGAALYCRRIGAGGVVVTGPRFNDAAFEGGMHWATCACGVPGALAAGGEPGVFMSGWSGVPGTFAAAASWRINMAASSSMRRASARMSASTTLLMSCVGDKGGELAGGASS